MEFERVIETELTSNKDYEILNSVLGQLSDGMWENSPRMNKYWLNISTEFIDGKVYIIVNHQSYISHCKQNIVNPFYNMDDFNIKFWFATKIKQIVKQEEKDNKASSWWKRTNIRELAYLGYKEKITVADCKAVFKKLKSF
jgi:hypothetical protein